MAPITAARITTAATATNSDTPIIYRSLQTFSTKNEALTIILQQFPL